MIRKVVENWLTSTTEREYQLPFCQVLTSQGHRILHVSSHGAGEHGKDIITLDASDKPCAYQLKTGDIGVPEWRAMKEEIRELADTKIRHPRVIRTRGWHQSYLVTNGRLTAEVKQKIEMMNEDYAGKTSRLDIIEYDELLGDFVRLHGDYVPTEIPDITLFLELLLADGTDVLHTGDFAKLLAATLPLGAGISKVGKQASRRAMSSALLLSAYVGQRHSSSHNHFAMVDLWFVLAMHVLAVAERFSLESKYWKPTLDLALLGVESAFMDALAELDDKAAEIHNLVEGFALTDFALLRPRILQIMGYLAARALSRRIEGVAGWRCEALDLMISKQLQVVLRFDPTHPYGEAAIPHLLLLAWYVERTGRSGDAAALVRSAVELILLLQKGQGMVNPYYGMEPCLRHHLGLGAIEESFAGRSYTIRSLVEWLARRHMRQYIAASWRPISHLQQCEFVPDEKWGYLLWRCDQGEERARFPDQQQSYSGLQRNYAAGEIPNVLASSPHLLPLFLAVYPHRLAPAFVWMTDSVLH